MANSYSDEKINLVLNKVSKTIYTELKNAGEIKSNELYLLPEDDLETANYATKEEVNSLSTATDNNLKTKASVDLANLTDAGNTVIDSRITAIMNSKAIVESGSNYVKFGNGLLIQWGMNYVNSGDTITFQHPYKKSCIVTSTKLATNASSSPDGARPVIGVNVNSLTSFICYNIWTTTNQEFNIKIYWLAIGY